MTTMQIDSSPAAARFQAAQSNVVPFRTTLVHTWYLTGRKMHALVRQPWVLAFSVIQPVIWLFLFGQLFRRVIDIPGFAYHGSYLAYLVPGVIAMNAMSNNMWAGMSMIEEIERGTLNRFLVTPASRMAIMNASVAEQAVATTVQAIRQGSWAPVIATGWIPAVIVATWPATYGRCRVRRRGQAG